MMYMYFGRLASALLLATSLTNADLSDDCVCYVGQEPRQGSDQPVGWSMPFKDPCECSETRLGGLNVRHAVKPYEMINGGKWRPVKDNQPDELMTYVTSSTVSSCVVYETITDEGRVPQDGMFDGYPINLHFSVKRSLGDKVEIEFNDIEGNELYALALYLNDSKVRIESSKAYVQFDFNDAHHFWVECLKGEVKFGKVGDSSTILTHTDLDYDNNEVKYIPLESDEETNWAFYGEGCP